MRALPLIVFVIGCSDSIDTESTEQQVGGSISDTHPSTTWAAGPFVVPNVSAQSGTLQCNAALVCDDFDLSVAVPAGYDANHALRIDVAWPQTAADFDVYVLDSSGNALADSATSGDPETVMLPAVTGTYKVRVVPFAPLAQSYSGTAALVTKPANPPPSTEPPPTYTAYAAPESMSNAHGAGEPSIGNNFKTGATMFESGTSTYRVTFDAAGAPTWTDVSAGLPACTAIASLDPILFTDHATGRTFESQLAVKSSLTCFTDDDGATWTPTAETGIDSGVDHQTIGGGAFGAGPIGPLPTYPNAVYYCSQDIVEAQCAVSHDGGLTFGLAIPIYTLLECGGIHGHIKVAPDGTAYVPNKSCGGNQGAAVSEDSGTTWTVRKDPASTPGDSDPSIGIGAGGTVYMGYHNSDGTPRVAVSHDKGKTWLHDQNVGATLGIHNIVFPAVVAGDDDRAAFVFIGTTTAGNYQDTANFHGVWHVYVATTYDAGVSWVTVDATPNDPVQKGSICTGGTTCGNDRNLLDFIDVTVDKTGRVLVAFADGCTGACATGGANNFDALASIVRQQTGRGLFAATDPFANLTVTQATVTTGSNGASTLSATLRNIGNKPASSAVVRFFDNYQLVGDAPAVTIAPGKTAVVKVPWSTKKLHGSRTVMVVADPADRIREISEADNTATGNVSLP